MSDLANVKMHRVCRFATIDFQYKIVVMGRDEPFFLGRVEPWLIALRMLYNNISHSNKVFSLDIILTSHSYSQSCAHNKNFDIHELLKRHIINYVGLYVKYPIFMTCITVEAYYLLSDADSIRV